MVAAAAAAGAEGSGPEPVIEKDQMGPIGRVDEAGMQRLAKGLPPRVITTFELSAGVYSGWLTYGSDECEEGSCHRNTPQVGITLDFQCPLTPAAIVCPADPQGALFFRDKDGAIQQVITTKDCCVVSFRKGAVMVKRYNTCDCRTGPDGLMTPLPDAECQALSEILDVTEKPGGELRVFEVRITERGSTKLTVIEFTERDAISQTLHHRYSGAKRDPGELATRSFFQRTIWPEGPGYRQVRKNEQATPGGDMVVTEHVIESWRVAKDGTRTKVETTEPAPSNDIHPR